MDNQDPTSRPTGEPAGQPLGRPTEPATLTDLPGLGQADPLAAQPGTREPTTAPHGGWTGGWRAALAGGVAGGVLAAAVAVPATLWVDARNDGGQVATAPESQQGFGGQSGDQFGDQFGGQAPQDQQPPWSDGEWPAATSTGEAATETQSEGVVLVTTVTPSGQGAGTGMVLDSEGTILTNYHVVEDSTEVTVTIASTGDSYSAEVVGYDEAADVAVLDVDASSLSTVALDDDGVDVGDQVTAVGNAQGQGSLSQVSGQVIAEEQDIRAGSGPSGLDSENLSGLIETNAAVVSGYSGGPMLDDEGEVVGISTAASSRNAVPAAMTTTAQSYAVPIDDAIAIVDRVEAGDESGDVTIGPAAWLGVGVADSSSTRVAEVTEGGAAETAGLRVGDTITGLDDTQVGSLDVLRTAIAAHEPGDRVRLRWTDGTGSAHSATVTLGESPVN